MSHFKRLGGKLFMVVDNDQMLTYVVQEADISDVEILSQKLGTTRDSIVFNNKFNNQDRLSIGQELNDYALQVHRFEEWNANKICLICSFNSRERR